jgi:hypothetical protein
VVSLGSPSQYIHSNLACGFARRCIPKLLACDQTPVNSLQDCGLAAPSEILVALSQSGRKHSLEERVAGAAETALSRQQYVTQRQKQMLVEVVDPQ